MSSCSICSLAISEDEDDYVSLQGSCTHKLHLGCWKDRQKCHCVAPEGLLNLEENLEDPLHILSKPPEPGPTDSSFSRLIGMFTRSIDSAVETKATNLIRQGVSITVLREQGYNARAIVLENPKVAPIMAAEYTPKQLESLGFDWELLIRGGLTVKTFPEVYRLWGSSLFQVFVKDLDSLMQLCSGDISQLPGLNISVNDLSLKVQANDLIAAELPPVCFLALGFSVEDWVNKLKLDTVAFLDQATIDHWKEEGDNKIAFEHYFPTQKKNLTWRRRR